MQLKLIFKKCQFRVKTARWTISCTSALLNHSSRWDAALTLAPEQGTEPQATIIQLNFAFLNSHLRKLVALPAPGKPEALTAGRLSGRTAAWQPSLTHTAAQSPPTGSWQDSLPPFHSTHSWAARTVTSPLKPKAVTQFCCAEALRPSSTLVAPALPPATHPVFVRKEKRKCLFTFFLQYIPSGRIQNRPYLNRMQTKMLLSNKEPSSSRKKKSLQLQIRKQRSRIEIPALIMLKA